MLCFSVVASVQAAIETPESCQQLVSAAIGAQPPYSNTQHELLSQALAQHAGIKISLAHFDSYAQALHAYAAGQIDLWLAAELSLLEQVDAWLVSPAYWHERYQLWFRVGELLDLQSVPELSGLRPAYWAEQIQQGQLTPWLGELRLEHGVEVSSQREAVQAVLAGEADFLLADSYVLAVDLHHLAMLDEFEALTQVRSTEPLYFALSANSACNDASMRKKLSQAVQVLNQQKLAQQLLNEYRQ